MSENPENADARTSDAQVAPAETISWGSGPATSPPGPSAKTWQAPAVLAVFLVIALVAAGAGIALGARGADELVATSAEAPANGVCRLYDSVAAVKVSNDSPTVPCTEAHSAETFAVADTLPDPGADFLWTVQELQDGAAELCGNEAAAKALGLSVPEYGTTRITMAFFTPTPGQAKAGARWVRCDHVLVDKSRASSAAGSFEDSLKIDGAFARCTGISVGAGVSTPTRCTDSADLSAVVGTVSVTDARSQNAISEIRDKCRKVAVEESGLADPQWGATLPPPGSSGGYALCALRADQWKVDRSAWPTEQVVDGAGDSVSV